MKYFNLNSFFLQSSYSIETFKLHAGARADHHSKYGSFLTGSAGISFYDFYFQYSQGYKPPSLYQLFGPDSFGSPVGNPNLVPEVNHSMEASWKKRVEVYELGLTAFQNRLSNLFTYSNGRGYFNQQHFITEGIEVSGKIKSSIWEYTGSFTHQQFKKEESPVLRRPYNVAQVGISCFPVETLELNFNARYYSSRKDLHAKLNPYEVIDLGIKKIWKNDEVVLQLRNLMNREYEEIYGYSILPRSIFTSYTYRF